MFIDEMVSNWLDDVFNMFEDASSYIPSAKWSSWESGLEWGCEPFELAMLLECCNHAAKSMPGSEWGMGDDFYALKTRGLNILAMIDPSHLHCSYDGIFYYEHPECGQMSFHDPYGNGPTMLDVSSIEWSGIGRQDYAFDILNDYINGREGSYEWHKDNTCTFEVPKKESEVKISKGLVVLCFNTNVNI